MEKRMLIYVAGPFTAKDMDGIMANLDRATAAANGVIARGHHPYLPHLTYYLAAHYRSNPFMVRQGASDYSDAEKMQGQNDRRWVDVDAPWVLLCDAIYIMPTAYYWNYDTFSDGERVWLSRGAKHEYEEALKAGRKVYWSLDEIPQADPWLGQH